MTEPDTSATGANDELWLTYLNYDRAVQQAVDNGITCFDTADSDLLLALSQTAGAAHSAIRAHADQFSRVESHLEIMERRDLGFADRGVRGESHSRTRRN